MKCKWMKTRAYFVSSLILFAYFANLRQFGNAAAINKVIDSSNINHAPTHMTNSTVSDPTTSISKENVSTANQMTTNRTPRFSTPDGYTVNVHRSSEEHEMFTSTHLSLNTSSTESASIKTPALETNDSKITSASQVTGKHKRTASTDNIQENITKIDNNGGNIYNTCVTVTDTVITVKNDYVVTEARTTIIAQMSEHTTVKLTVGQSFTEEKITSVLRNYVSPGVCVFGILCNIVNMIVLVDAVLSETPYIYLTSLAITDMGVLILVFIFNVFVRKSKEYAAVVFTTYVFFPVVNILMDASIWVTCVLTLERIIYIKRPLLARSVCTRKRAKCFIYCIFLFDVLINIPRFFLYRPFCVNGECSHAMTTFMQSEIFSYISWSYIALINVLPLLILLMSNLYMVKVLHISTQERKRMQPHLGFQSESNYSKGYQANKLTLTLISTVFLFIVCTFPSAFTELKVSHTFFGGNMNIAEFIRTDWYRILIGVSNTLLIVDCSLNFFLYCALNDKYRSVLRSKITSIFRIKINSSNPKVVF